MGIHYDVLLLKKERAEKEDNRIDKLKVTSVGRHQNWLFLARLTWKKARLNLLKTQIKVRLLMLTFRNKKMRIFWAIVHQQMR